MAMKHKGSLEVTKDLTVDDALTVTNGMTVAGLAYPTSDGTANQVIKTNGAGTLSFTDQTGGGASAGNVRDGVMLARIVAW